MRADSFSTLLGLVGNELKLVDECSPISTAGRAAVFHLSPQRRSAFAPGLGNFQINFLIFREPFNEKDSFNYRRILRLWPAARQQFVHPRLRRHRHQPRT